MTSNKIKFSLLIEKIIAFNRISKTLIVVFSDYILLVLSFWLSLSIRDNAIYIPSLESNILILLGPFIAIPIFYSFGLYSSLIRYSNYQSLLTIMIAVSLYTIFWFSIVLLVGLVSKPYDFLIINWLIATFFTGGIRYFARWFLSFKTKNYTNVVIYGAGSSGIQIESALNFSSEIKVVGFIDDDVRLQTRFIEGIKVYSSSMLSDLIVRKGIKEVLLAMPSVSRSNKKKILQSLKKYPVILRSLPDLTEIAQGKISISDLKKIKIEDLLRREARQPDKKLLTKDVTHKNIMITGAGGSIGSELCRQIVKNKPNVIVIYDISELALYSIERELLVICGDTKIITIMGDILDQSRLKMVINTHNVNTIYHTAAYKHVPLVEKNIVSGVSVNIFGTLSSINAAIDSNVENFVFISTDKAVRPTNIMGATKRFAELILQALAKEQRIKQNRKSTKISIVRFGNVLGSSGSVVPLFYEQIRNGGPITITDPNIIRYFMTVTEAAQLVIQAGAMQSDGDVFLLDMGEPVEVVNLAKDMIRLSGMTIKDQDNQDGDIEIIYTGLRPGEKLKEELLIGENSKITEHERIMKASEEFLDFEALSVYLSRLKQAKEDYDIDKIKKIFQQTVDGYK